jgi:hypothetical protein
LFLFLFFISLILIWFPKFGLIGFLHLWSSKLCNIFSCTICVVILFVCLFFSASYPTVQGSGLCSEFNAGECFSNAQYCSFSQLVLQLIWLSKEEVLVCVCVCVFFLIFLSGTWSIDRFFV